MNRNDDIISCKCIFLIYVCFSCITFLPLVSSAISLHICALSNTSLSVRPSVCLFTKTEDASNTFTFRKKKKNFTTDNPKKQNVFLSFSLSLSLSLSIYIYIYIYISLSLSLSLSPSLCLCLCLSCILNSKFHCISIFLSFFFSFLYIFVDCISLLSVFLQFFLDFCLFLY